MAPVCYYGGDHASFVCVAALTFGPCTKHEDCPGPDGFCYGLSAGYSAGLCSRPYSSERDGTGCGPGASPGDEIAGADARGAYGRSVCAPACRTGADCEARFACAGNACVAHCTSDAQCPATGCNRYTHHCGSVDVTLQDDGAACAFGGDCRSGWCHGSQAGPTATGFLDGLCVSSCVQPEDSAYGAASLPASDCPNDEVCAPTRSAGATAGLLSECRPRCTTDADCRIDYVCARAGPPGAPDISTEGFCGIRRDPLLAGR